MSMRPGQWAVFAALVVAIIGSAAFAVHRIRHRPLATPAPSASASMPGVPPALRELVGAMDLPESSEADRHEGQVNVLITPEAVHVEHERIASLPVASGDGNLQRVDEVFNALKARRDQWKTNNPGRSFDGVVALWVDRRVSVYAVKSVFVSAAFVGYTSLGFVARCRCPQGITVLPAHARVPTAPRPDPPSKEPPAHRRALLVLQRTDAQIEAVWRADDIQAEPRAVAPNDLLASIEQLWAQTAPLRVPNEDPRQDAVLSVNDALSFGSIVPALAALALAKQTPALPGTPPSPAFRTSFGVNNPALSAAELAALPPPSEAARVSGRLDPRVIQKVVRSQFKAYRGCYAALLAKEPTAGGHVPMRFVIGLTGDVSDVEISDRPVQYLPTPPTEPRLRDPQLERCLIAAFKKLKFPPPEGGIVTVAYPLALAPAVAHLDRPAPH